MVTLNKFRIKPYKNINKIKFYNNYINIISEMINNII